MDIIHRCIGGVTILELRGRLTVGPTEAEVVPFRAALKQLLAEGQVRIALDLARVTHIDARGLAELALAYTTLHRHSGELTLVATPPRVKQLLSVTRLDTVFEQCDSVRDLIERADECTAAADSRWASERLPAGV